MDKYAAETLRTRNCYHYLKSKGRDKEYYKYLKNEIMREELYKLVPSEKLENVIHEEIGDKIIKRIFENIDNMIEYWMTRGLI